MDAQKKNSLVSRETDPCAIILLAIDRAGAGSGRAANPQSRYLVSAPTRSRTRDTCGVQRTAADALPQGLCADRCVALHAGKCRRASYRCETEVADWSRMHLHAWESTAREPVGQVLSSALTLDTRVPRPGSRAAT